VFISSIRVDPGPRNRGPTSLLVLKIRTPVANTGKLRSIGEVPVESQLQIDNGSGDRLRSPAGPGQSPGRGPPGKAHGF
jgi:hypothetical protein